MRERLPCFDRIHTAHLLSPLSHDRNTSSATDSIRASTPSQLLLHTAYLLSPLSHVRDTSSATDGIRASTPSQLLPDILLHPGAYTTLAVLDSRCQDMASLTTSAEILEALGPRSQSAMYVAPSPLLSPPVVCERGANHPALTQLFKESTTGPGNGWPNGCELRGFSVGGGDRLRNLGESQRRASPTSSLTLAGSILIDGIAILVTMFLLWRSQRKKAAVGRR